MSRTLPATFLARLALASGVASALPTASVVWAQAQKDQADAPKSATTVITVEKTEAAPAKVGDGAMVKGQVKTIRKVEIAPAQVAAPAIIEMQKPAMIRANIPFPPAVVVAGAAPAANLEPMIQQITQQLRPLFRLELRFLSSTSDPSPTQRREIAIEGARAVKEAAKQLATVQHALQNGGWRGGVIPDGRKMVREGVRAAAKAKLSPEQFARYQEELEVKARDQRKSIALGVVANLDRILFLSIEQRDKIGEVLLANWNESTFPTLENLVNYEQYFPVLPDRHLIPLLNDAQRTTWNGVQKVTFGQSFNFQFNNGMPLDPADQDEDEKAAMAEVEKTK